MKNMNGWLRLYVVIIIVYSATILTVGVSNMPDVLDINYELEEIMPQKALDIIYKSDKMPTSKDPNKIALERAGIVLGGHFYFLESKDIPQKEIDYALHEYTKANGKVLIIMKQKYIIRMIAFWIMPCIILFLVGNAINWIYKGFKQKANS